MVFCSSTANSWFQIFSFLIPLPEANSSPSKTDFLSKNLKTTGTRPASYPSYFEFLAIFNALSPNILSEAVLLVKSFKSP